jgi:hypothetical protein
MNTFCRVYGPQSSPVQIEPWKFGYTGLLGPDRNSYWTMLFEEFFLITLLDKK